jgi:DNA-binding response OmpR family regulator
VIVVTGFAFRAIEQGALEAGAAACLTRPCLPEDLELEIRALLIAPDA